MSAYIVTHTHINAIVTWASDRRVTFTYGSPGWDATYQVQGSEQATAELLYAANVISVNYRYKLDDPVGTVTYGPTSLYRPIEIIKLCSSLEYQSCEHPGWDDSLAKKLLDEIRHAAITKLPGYDAAPWSI